MAQKFRDGGWEALAERIAEGPTPKLTEKQRQQVKRWILGKDPRQYGFDFGLWSRRIVQALIQERMGVALGLTAVGRLLASLEITPQKPLRRAYERDPQGRRVVAGGNLSPSSSGGPDGWGPRSSSWTKRVFNPIRPWDAPMG